MLLMCKRSARRPARSAHRLSLVEAIPGASAHRRTLEKVRRLLRVKGIRFRAVYRARFTDRAPYDGVISVGGDGTFLEAARQVRTQWILGVNSDPARSAGSFCTANGSNFAQALDRLLKNRAGIQRLNRVQLRMGGRPLKVLVLNDLLVTHRKPAAMSRYWLRVGRVREEQWGSGLWIATAAGSTGALRSAGGRKIPRESKALQYKPRELYRGPGFRYRLTGGIIPPGRSVRIGSLMQDGLICIDGEHVTFPFKQGETLSIRSAPYPLRVVRC
ncbi:MAG: NAD(+)/NADH kinase [Candidatus Omnitrophica bacterium]|nr:NAD(+)/NADH kinase [Candidatus Omnitrophota bacterium]